MTAIHRLCVSILMVAVLTTPLAKGAADHASEWDQAWTLLPNIPPAPEAAVPWVSPKQGTACVPNWPALRALLDTAPQEQAVPSVAASAAVIALPTPDGGFERFAFVQSSIMEPELQAKVPDIRTYLGQGIDNPASTVRFDVTTTGFHALVLGPRGLGARGMTGAYSVSPLFHGDTTTHVSAYLSDHPRAGPFACGTTDEDMALIIGAPDSRAGFVTRGTIPSGEVVRRTLRIAIAATGEFTTAVSQPNPADVFTAFSVITTTVNQLNAIYEVECAVRFIMVGQSLLLIQTNAASDPFTGDPAGSTYSTNESARMGENQTFLDGAVGQNSYDIGHLFHWVSSGFAGRAGGSACSSGRARATSASSNIGGPRWTTDLVAHEIGHQLTASHTFNGSQGSCGNAGEYQSSFAFEPGSGSTIMSYAGNCGLDNIVGMADPMFLWRSLIQIRTFVNNGTGCGDATPTGNNNPVIPPVPLQSAAARTPFVINAQGGDPDFQDLTTTSYSWEGRDLGPQGPPSGDTGTIKPLFRALPPAISSSRTIPSMSSLVDSLASPGENLPASSLARAFTFVIRDNRAGAGGVAIASAAVNFADSGRAFRITTPFGQSMCAGQPFTLSWDTASTQNPPLSESNVDIQLSFDGGNTFPWTLFGNAANIGAALVTLPTGFDTHNAVIRIAARNAIFFAVSPRFHLVDSPPTVTAQPTSSYVCPGATVTISAAFGGGSPDLLNTGQPTFGRYRLIKDGAAILGSVLGPSFSFPNADALISGDYSIEASNACGTVRTQTVRVQVGITPGDGIADVVASACQPAELFCPTRGVPKDTCLPSNAGLCYQWRRNGVPISSDERIDALGAHLRFTYTTWADQGDYDCIVTDRCGELIVQNRTVIPFRPARLTITPEPQWVRRDPVGAVPPPRAAHAMTFDAARGVLVVYGGLSRDTLGQSLYLSDTWEFDGSAWTLRSPTTSPGALANHAMVYDSVRNRIVLFGGSHALCSTGCAAPPRAQVWEYDGANWSQRMISGGPSDSAAANPALAYDPVAQRVVLYTSSGGTSPYAGETWELDLAGSGAWNRLATLGPPTAYGYPAMYFDPVRGKRVVYCYTGNAGVIPGAIGTGIYQWNTATAAWDVSWSSANTPGDGAAPWATFAGGAWAYDPVRKRAEFGLSRFIPLGGGGVANNTFAFDVGAAPSPTPSRLLDNNNFGVSSAAQVWDPSRNCMMIFGGSNEFPGSPNQGQPVNALWERHYADAALILDQPQSVAFASGVTTQFRVVATGAPTLSFQWFRGGVAVVNGPGGASAGGGTVTGATAATLQIANAQASDQGVYTVRISNGCATVLSRRAAFNASGTLQTSDFNGDGAVSVQDIFEFLSAWFTADPRADLDGGGISVQDIFDFLNAWFSGT